MRGGRDRDGAAMSVTTQNSASFASPSIIGDASPGDYFALLKPRVMSLVVWTALAGVLCAPTPVHPVVGFAALLAIASLIYLINYYYYLLFISFLISS